MKPTAVETMNRVFDRCVMNGDCWLWTGAASHGYGRIGAFGKLWQAHRLAYTLLVADIPDGLHIDHLCFTRLCLNPDHLDPVPQLVNNQRAWDAQPVKSKCANGHKWTPENTYMRRGTRSCKACRLERRANPPVLTPDDPRHGKPSTYINYACRCDLCKRAAAADYQRKRAARAAA